MSKRVLICDDEVHVTTPLAIKFRKAGFDVVTAADGEAAWQAIQEQVPDLLITDICMPGLDGYRLVDRIRDDEKTRQLPVVMLTSTTIDRQIQEIMDWLGVIEVMHKPYSGMGLLKIAERELGLAALPAP